MAFNIALLSFFALLITLSAASKCALSDSDCVTALASSHVDDLLSTLRVRSGQFSLGTVATTVDTFYFDFENVTATIEDPINVKNITFDTSFNVCSIQFETSLELCFPRFVTSGVVFELTLDATGSGCISGKNINFYLAVPYTITTNSDGNDVLSLSSYEYNFIIETITYAFVFDDSALDTVNSLLNLTPISQVLARKHGPAYYGVVAELVFNALNTTAAATPLADYFTY